MGDEACSNSVYVAARLFLSPPMHKSLGMKVVMILSFFFVFADEKPNLVNLISFPGRKGKINIPQQISAKYFMFGVLLLNDQTGAEVSTIVAKYHGDAEQINLEILRLWIGGRGKPLSWDILIGVLEEIGLGNLASDIKNGLH